MAAGAVAVTATSIAGTATAALTAIALPSVLHVVQAPPGEAIAGETLTPGLVIQLLLADGTTPVAGQPVTFTVGSGGAVLAACGSPMCTVQTDARGIAATTITPSGSGMLQIWARATGLNGPLQEMVATTVVARQRSAIASQPVTYIAEGASATWTAQVSLSDNLLTTDGVSVLWTGATGMNFSSSASVASGAEAEMGVQASGLGAGVRVQGSACAWGGVCATFVAEGVSASTWQVQVVSGSGQQVNDGSDFQPVVMRIVDAAGHPVVGADVALYQSVTAAQQSCSARGRCPSPALLTTSAMRLTSDAAGLITLPSSQVCEATVDATTNGEVIQITVSAGTQGSGTATLFRLPHAL